MLGCFATRHKCEIRGVYKNPLYSKKNNAIVRTNDSEEIKKAPQGLSLDALRFKRITVNAVIRFFLRYIEQYHLS